MVKRRIHILLLLSFFFLFPGCFGKNNSPSQDNISADDFSQGESEEETTPLNPSEEENFEEGNVGEETTSNDAEQDSASEGEDNSSVVTAETESVCIQKSYFVYESNRDFSPENDQVNSGSNTNIWLGTFDGQHYPLTQFVNATITEPAAFFDEGTLVVYFVSDGNVNGEDQQTLSQTKNIWKLTIANFETNLAAAFASLPAPEPMTQMTAMWAHSQLPKISPDGTQVLYQSRRPLDGSNGPATSTWNLWLLNVADGQHQLLPTTERAIQAFWSYDGEKIYYNSTRHPAPANSGSYGWNIFWLSMLDLPLMLSDTGYLNWTVQYRHPRPNPADTIVAYHSDRGFGEDESQSPNSGGVYNIWLTTLNSSGYPLGSSAFTTSVVADSRQVHWDPTGATFIFHSKLDPFDQTLENTATDGSHYFNLWRGVLADGTFTPLTQFHNFESTNPVFLNDNQQILFNSSRALDGTDTLNNNGNQNIMIMNSDGTEQNFLTDLINADSHIFIWNTVFDTEICTE